MFQIIPSLEQKRNYLFLMNWLVKKYQAFGDRIFYYGNSHGMKEKEVPLPESLVFDKLLQSTKTRLIKVESLHSKVVPTATIKVILYCRLHFTLLPNMFCHEEVTKQKQTPC